MRVANKRLNILSKVVTIAILFTCVYAGGSNKEVYAAENNNEINQSYRRANDQTGKIKPCDFLNVRSGASVNNSVVTKVYTNDVVEVLEKNNNGWYKIKPANGQVGWVNGKYVQTQNDNNNQVSDKSKKVVDLAHKQLGKPYSWGANGPNSFDCSGLTSYVYKNAANVNLPRTSTEQVNVGKTVSKNNLKAGDLVFFSSTGKGITHVGLYIGGSKMIHSPKPGENVKIDNINSSYYSRTYVTAKSIL